MVVRRNPHISVMVQEKEDRSQFCWRSMGRQKGDRDLVPLLIYFRFESRKMKKSDSLLEEICRRNY